MFRFIVATRIQITRTCVSLDISDRSIDSPETVPKFGKRFLEPRTLTITPAWNPAAAQIGAVAVLGSPSYGPVAG